MGLSGSVLVHAMLRGRKSVNPDLTAIASDPTRQFGEIDNLYKIAISNPTLNEKGKVELFLEQLLRPYVLKLQRPVKHLQSLLNFSAGKYAPHQLLCAISLHLQDYESKSFREVPLNHPQ